MEFAKNASKLHKKIGEILSVTPPFKGSRLFQEVPVRDLFPSYVSGRDRYDWVIPEHSIVIEAMGVQHFSAQSFGGSAENAAMNFSIQKRRDNAKEEIAILNGWTYIAISYKDYKLIDSAYLLNKYTENLNTNPLIEKVKPIRNDKSAWKEAAKLKAKAYRKLQYQKLKQLRKEKI